jgi:hypothetical protein
LINLGREAPLHHFKLQCTFKSFETLLNLGREALLHHYNLNCTFKKYETLLFLGRESLYITLTYNALPKIMKYS